LLYNDPVVPLYGSSVRVGAMANEDYQSSGVKSRLSDYRSQIIFLGLIGSAVAAIALIFPAFWRDHWIPILLIAGGLGMPALFSLWNYWVGYGWQVGIAPALAFLLMGIFNWLFRYDAEALWEDAVFNLLQTNLFVLAIWLILVFLAFRSRFQQERKQNQNDKQNKKNTKQDYRKGEVWRDYRWIIAPAVIILLFLFDTSWAQSTLSTSSLKKSVIKATPPGAFQIHAEYPLQISFDDAEPSEIHLWATGTVNCMDLEISADGLLFALKPQSGEPLVWNDILAFKLSKSSNAVTLLVIADERPTTGSRSIELTLNSGGNKLDTSNWAIRIESRKDSQIRGWKKNFLDAGSTIVSLITAVFVGVKQLEEEKKRQKIKQVEQVISKLETEAKENFSKTLKDHWELTDDWNEWDRALQSQFRDKYATFVEKDLWDAIANKTLEEVKKGVNLLLHICERIFEDKESKPISIVKQLQKALENDAQELLSMLKEYPESIGVARRIEMEFSPEGRLKIIECFEEFSDQIHNLWFFESIGISDSRIKQLSSVFEHHPDVLLSIIKKYPESIGVAKQIASNLPDDLKKEIPEKYKDEFLQEIILLKEELGFPDTESFPLQSQFRFSTVPSRAEARLAAWLEKQGLRCSPFADAGNPYTSTPKDEKLLIEQVPAGFSFPAFEHSTQNFAFSNSWDVGAALFGYARNLPPKIKDKTFVAALPPSMIANFGVEQPRTLFLHALAEGWAWTLADAPATYYSLGKSQRGLAGRLLRWHGGSPFAIVRSLEQILGSRKKEITEKEEKSTQKFLEHVAAWLENVEANDLRKEEAPALIELRPLSKQQFTLALVSSVDLNFAASGEMLPATHQALDGEAEWLKAHGWTLVHFMISDSNPQRISEEKLAKQCQQRVQICSNGEVEALESLFAPHPEEESADLLLARKAAGSPGKMVRLGQKLLLQHVEKYPPDEPLHIEDLLALA